MRAWRGWGWFGGARGGGATEVEPGQGAGASRGIRGQGPGFSLVEVLLAVLVLGLVLSTYLSAVVTVRVIMHHLRIMSQAIAVADEVTEELLILDASDDLLTLGQHSRQYDREGHLVLSGSGFFETRWTVTNSPDVTGIRQLDVEIRWSERGSPRHLSWVTFRN